MKINGIRDMKADGEQIKLLVETDKGFKVMEMCVRLPDAAVEIEEKRVEYRHNGIKIDQFVAGRTGQLVFNLEPVDDTLFVLREWE